MIQCQNMNDEDVKQITTAIKPVITEAICEFADEFLIPRMDEMIKESEGRLNERIDNLGKRVAKLEYDLKSYIDDRMADYTSDIFKRLEKRYALDRKYKEKVLELVKRNNLGTSEEIAYLEGIVEAV